MSRSHNRAMRQIRFQTAMLYGLLRQTLFFFLDLKYEHELPEFVLWYLEQRIQTITMIVTHTWTQVYNIQAILILLLVWLEKHIVCSKYCFVYIVPCFDRCHSFWFCNIQNKIILFKYCLIWQLIELQAVPGINTKLFEQFSVILRLYWN